MAELHVASPLSLEDVLLQKMTSTLSMTTMCSAYLSALLLTEANLALAKRDRTSFLDPPTHQSSNSGADTILGDCAQSAQDIVCASAVLSHPIWCT
eukprot:10248549-Ditylum_brightwellii.AAC.1